MRRCLASLSASGIFSANLDKVRAHDNPSASPFMKAGPYVSLRFDQIAAQSSAKTGERANVSTQLTAKTSAQGEILSRGVHHMIKAFAYSPIAMVRFY